MPLKLLGGVEGSDASRPKNSLDSSDLGLVAAAHYEKADTAVPAEDRSEKGQTGS